VDPLTSAYLLTARLDPQRVAILRWSQALAAREDARTACSPEHALEIVAHRMISGRLDLNFTEATPQKTDRKRQSPTRAEDPSKNYHPIGELVINRDSVRKLVASDPDALASVLDSLLEALQYDGGLLGKKPSLRTTATRLAIA
jgi:hypothetical protein